MMDMPQIPKFLLVKNRKKKLVNIDLTPAAPVDPHAHLPPLPPGLRYAVTPAEEAGWFTDDGVVPQRWHSDEGVIHQIERRTLRKHRAKSSTTLSEPRQARTRVDRTGLVSIAQIAADIKIETKIARRALRATMKKPPIGWYFAADEIKQVKENIASWILKQQKSKLPSSSPPAKSQSKTTRKSALSKSKASPKPRKNTSKKQSRTSKRKR